MNKYIAEFIGTFFLVLTVGCTVVGNGAGAFAPLAIGSALMVMIFAGGHISGGHFNPAVTLGVWLRGKCEAKDVLPYMISQIVGAVLAAFAVKFLKGGSTVSPLQPAVLPALLAEFLFMVLPLGSLCWSGHSPSATSQAEPSIQRSRWGSPLWGCRPGRISGFILSLISLAAPQRRALSRW